MLVIEAKLKGTQSQYGKLDEVIRTGQFIRNTCLRHWEDNKGVTRNDLQKLCSVLAKNKETPWTKKLVFCTEEECWYNIPRTRR